MKIKTIAAALALLSTATAANAAWNEGTGKNTGDLIGNGELVLAIWDDARKVSVLQDLGGSYVDFYNNFSNGSFAQSYQLDPLVASTFAGSNAGDIVYSVMANNYGYYDAPGYNEPARFSNGIMVTSNVVNPTYDRGNGNESSLQNDSALALANILNGTSTNVDYAANEAVYGDSTNGKYAGANTIYGSNLFNYLPNVTASVNDSLYFWAFLSSQVGSQDIQAVGQWNIDLASNTLTYAAPVPAAVWLFASGLLGLGTISRRRKA